MFKKVLIGIALLVAAVFTIGMFSKSSSLTLELYINNGWLVVKNAGTGPVELLDVIINDRMECSLPLYTDKGQTQEQLHRVWLGVKDNKPVVLKVGDIKHFITPCPSYVRVTITTDQGSATYSF